MPIDKFALAQKCLSAAHTLDASNPTVHVQTLRLRKALDNPKEPLAPEVSESVNAELEKLLPKTQDLDEWNNNFLSVHKDSVPHIQAALSCRQLINPDSKAQNEKDLAATLDSSNISTETALAGRGLLDEWRSEQATKQAYAEKAKKKWPESSVFDLE